MTGNRRAFDTAAVAAALLVSAAVSMADEPVPRTTHIIDTLTDRTPLKTTFPKYPRIARRDRIEGDATVCFIIDQRGRIRSARVREASHRIFKRPALRAIRNSAFEPLKPNDILDTARTCRTYRFRLEPILVAENPPGK